MRRYKLKNYNGMISIYFKLWSYNFEKAKKYSFDEIDDDKFQKYWENACKYRLKYVNMMKKRNQFLGI